MIRGRCPASPVWYYLVDFHVDYRWITVKSKEISNPVKTGDFQMPKVDTNRSLRNCHEPIDSVSSLDLRCLGGRFSTSKTWPQIRIYAQRSPNGE